MGNEEYTAIRNYFVKLGFDPDIADIYLALHTKGPQTIAALARNSGIERTRIYRLLDSMQEKTLVEVETHYKRKILRAVPLSNLHIFFSKKDQELTILQQELPQMEQLMQKIKPQTDSTSVQFYHGLDGVKQILWNETKAKSEIVALLYENIQIRTQEKFFERWVNVCNERNLRIRGVISDTFLQSQKHWYSKHTNEMLNNWNPRYIKNEVFPIGHSTIIYDDVVAYYDWKDNEIFGVEIHNSEIADAQRRLFEMLWGMASPDMPDNFTPDRIKS